jgi:5-methylcytosine-specific restriction endonuclease McrA
MGTLSRKVGGDQKAPTTKHKTTSERGYGHQWKKIRLTVLANYGGICANCKSAWAVCVHHKDHDPHNNNEANLTPLCIKCHQEEHRQNKEK